MKTILGANVSNKKVLARVDFNVPQKAGVILDDSRIRASLPTLRYLLKQNVSQVVLISHLGRPKGQPSPEYKLYYVAQKLSEILKLQGKISFSKIDSFLGYKISDKIFLLENIRFYKEEEKNDFKFAQKLASLGDLFINDAFSCSHRSHASVEGITHFLPAYSGFYLEKEVENLAKLLKTPKRLFVCILGGAKVSDKIAVIDNLASKVDWFLLGGVMANTFLKVKGVDIKSSAVANEMLDEAKRIMENCGDKIVLPKDYIFGKLDGRDAILDIGKESIAEFNQYILRAKTIFWNGTLGMAEEKKFSEGSREIAHQITSSQAKTIAGGGDTVSFLKQYHFFNKFTFVSLGGGATLEFLAGKTLPGLKALC